MAALRIQPAAEISEDELLPEPEDLDALEDVELDPSLELSPIDGEDEPMTEPILDEPDLIEIQELFEPPGTELNPADDPEAGS